MRRLAQQNPISRQALTVVRLVGGSPASSLLQQGDLLLAIDAKVVTRFKDVESAVADRAQVDVTVWRGKGELTVRVPTAELPGTDIERHRRVGRSYSPGATSGDVSATRHPAGRRLCWLFCVRLAGDTLWTLSRAAGSSRLTVYRPPILTRSSASSPGGRIVLRCV